MPWVVGIDDLVGAHGGVGGMQTRPFLVYPAAWAGQPPRLVGAHDIHRFLRRHLYEDSERAADSRAEEPPIAACSTRAGATEYTSQHASRPGSDQ